MKFKRLPYLTIVLLVLAIFMSLFTGCTTKEIPIPDVKENVYIYDEDNIIDDDIEQKLNTMLVDLESQTEAEVVVISVEGLLDKSIEDYANKLFNTLGIGKKGKDNGILLLISRSDEKVRLEIGRGLEGCLNDAKCGSILDDFFVPYRESDEYTKATDLTIQAVLKVLSEEYEITIKGLDTEAIQIEDPKQLTMWQWALIIFAILIVLIVIECISGHFMGDGFGDGIIFLILTSFDGGDSGGGFGGGFSGGGGASR